MQASSLAVPFQALADSFRHTHPDVIFRMESAGSLEAIRRIAGLGRQADVVALADERLIRELLIPDYAQWCIPFAANDMVLAFRPNSKGANEINADNWIGMLMNEGIAAGRSDPNLNPCGYRTLMLFQLAEKYYGNKDLARQLTALTSKHIRPREADLTSLLKSGHLDYAFVYRSVAIQHGLHYIELPDEINFSRPELAPVYQQAQLNVHGARPNEQVLLKGEPIVYGLTVLNHAQNREVALQFVAYIVSDTGQRILLAHGHQPMGYDSAVLSQIPELWRFLRQE